MIKRSCMLLLAVLSSNANANTVFNGAYNCSLYFASRLIAEEQYFVVQAHNDGLTGIAPLYVNEDNPPFLPGYGVGTLSANRFSGKTQSDLPLNFSFTLANDTITAQGEITAMIQDVKIKLTLSCIKTW